MGCDWTAYPTQVRRWITNLIFRLLPSFTQFYTPVWVSQYIFFLERMVSISISIMQDTWCLLLVVSHIHLSSAFCPTFSTLCNSKLFCTFDSFFLNPILPHYLQVGSVVNLLSFSPPKGTRLVIIYTLQTLGLMTGISLFLITIIELNKAIFMHGIYSFLIGFLTFLLHALYILIDLPLEILHYTYARYTELV